MSDLLSELKSMNDRSKSCNVHQGPEFLEWLGADIIAIVNDFAGKDRLSESNFIRRLNKIFRTSRFEILLKRWLAKYFVDLFTMMNEFANYRRQAGEKLNLIDVYVNRFAFEKYCSRFGDMPNVTWKKPSGIKRHILGIIKLSFAVIYLSLENGLKIFLKRRKYKVMREAVWGLYDTKGYYFHDDFLVDGVKIKEDDLLLYSRGIPAEQGRLKAYHDAKKSPYRHVNLYCLPVSLKVLVSRIIPKYSFSAPITLFKEMNSPHFLLFKSIFLHFIYNALPYERLFSNYEVVSELGHNYFSPSHIAEAIICENHGAKYYLTHWSDHSTPMNSWILSFLGCDRFFSWGKAHMPEIEKDSKYFMFTGYPFKRSVRDARSSRSKILSDMGVKEGGKVVSFFDESFGGNCNMKEENFVEFWETALRFAEKDSKNIVLIKPKVFDRNNDLSYGLRRRFMDVRDKIQGMQNAYIITPDKWSFIEVIAVSDIVVTQGMASSATIAIICGIEGLYLNQMKEEHPFSKAFKDRLVFYDAEKLLSMVNRIISGQESPLRDIPEHILRAFDEYPDDRGIDLCRDILSGSAYQG